MKIAIYGCGEYAKKMLPFVARKGIMIEYFVQTKKTMDNYSGYPVKNLDEINWKDFDYLVLSSCLYKNDMLSELKNLPDWGKIEPRVKTFSTFLDLFFDDSARYRSVTVKEGLHYIFSRDDEILGPQMLYNGINHGSEIMKKLFNIARENPNFKRNGFFLDIGANIGTASIYAKHLNPSFKIIAFEPEKTNFKILKCNCILNNMDDIILENCALGKKTDMVSFLYTSDNPGGSHVSNLSGGTERVKMTSLDAFCSSKNLLPSDISFIWLDVEGFEDEVIIGAKTVIQGGGYPYCT